MPGKTVKFNFTLINTHTKYPFKFILQNDYNIASCDMNKDDMSGNLVFEENCPMEIDERETSALLLLLLLVQNRLLMTTIMIIIKK